MDGSFEALASLFHSPPVLDGEVYQWHCFFQHMPAQSAAFVPVPLRHNHRDVPHTSRTRDGARSLLRTDRIRSQMLLVPVESFA